MTMEAFTIFAPFAAVSQAKPIIGLAALTSSRNAISCSLKRRALPPSVCPCPQSIQLRLNIRCVYREGPNHELLSFFVVKCCFGLLLVALLAAPGCHRAPHLPRRMLTSRSPIWNDRMFKRRTRKFLPTHNSIVVAGAFHSGCWAWL